MVGDLCGTGEIPLLMTWLSFEWSVGGLVGCPDSGWLFCCCWSAGRGDPERRKFLAYSGTEVGGIVLCGENTRREGGCKKQQLFTLCIKLFTCIYSVSESLNHSSSIYNKRCHPLHKLIYTAFMFPQRHSSVWGEYRGRNGENGTFLPEDSPEYGWITQDYTLGNYSERKELLLLNSFFAHLEVKLHGPIKRQNV